MIKQYLIAIFAPGHAFNRYKIWVALSVIIQAACTLVPNMVISDPKPGQWIFLGTSAGISLASLFITKQLWQTTIAYILAFYGLIVTLLLVVLDLTNTGIHIYLLAWSMSVSLGYGREYFNLKLFFGFMSTVLTFFAIALYFSPNTEYSGIERLFSILSGTFVITVNIYLWSREADMSENHYSDRRQKYEDIVDLSEKMTAIMVVKETVSDAFKKMSAETQRGLRLDHCAIYLAEEGELKSVIDGHTIQLVDENIVADCYKKQEPIMVSYSGLTIYSPPREDIHANSEIASPIFNDGKISGVIYGSCAEKGILRDRHFEAMNVIASFCGLRMTQRDAEESIRLAERTRAEVDRYRELDELKNRFIANISHDLKTPLSLIKAPAKQIAQITPDRKVRALSHYIINNADHLNRVVHQLLQLNRVEKGVNELYFEKINIPSLLQKISGQYEERARSKNIVFTVESDDVSIVTDAFRLEQVIHNLVSNAMRYTEAEGFIKISVRSLNDRIQCHVEDNGIGIAPELQEKIFDRFFKIDENNQEGTGIGLSLVKEYVKLLEGEVELESEPGKGSTFTVHLPISHPASAMIEEASSSSIKDVVTHNDTKPHLLIVEDHADLNQFISTLFESEFVTFSAFDGDEALNSIKQNTPDIIITDLMMPKLNGKLLVEEIRKNEELDHIPIIVLSAKSQVDSKIDLYEIGTDNFLAKPFDAEELQAIVKATLKRRQQLRKNLREKFLQFEAQLDSSEIETDAIQENESDILQELRRRVLEELDNNELKINDIAIAMGIGRNRFQKEIKDLTGITPVEFVRSVRLQEAYKKLSDKSLSISEVAYSVGFNNLSYFTRSFKQEFGMLPSEVR